MTAAVLIALKQRLHHLATGEGLKARLIRGGLGSAGIQAANRVLSLALGIVLARTLGAEGYGVYAYAFAIMSLLMVAAEAGVPTLLMREVAASQARAEWGLLRGVLRRAGQFVALAACTVALIGLLVLWAVGDRLSPVMLYTMALTLLVLPLLAGTKTVAHALKGLHRVVLGQAVNMLLRPLLVLTLVGAGFLLWPELRQPQYAMAAQLLGTGVVLIAGLFILRSLMPRDAKTALPAYRSREWLRNALPFTLIGGAGIINNHVDILMLGWFVDSETVGVYRVASQGAVLVSFSLQAASAVVAPNFSKLHSAADQARLKRLFQISRKLTTLFSLPVAVTFVFLGSDLLGIAFGAQYVAGGIYLSILSLGYALNVAFGPVGILMQMSGFESITARVLWGSTLINLVLNVVVIPLYGAAGAAIVTAFSVSFYHGWLRYCTYRLLGF